MRLDLTRLFRTAEAEPARTDEPWMQQARIEGITEDEISRVAKMDIEYPIFFARMLHGNEIDPAHFEDESRSWLDQFKTFKQNFAPKTLNEMYKLSDLTTKLMEIQDVIKKLKGEGKNWFNSQGAMKRMFVVKSNAHVYEVYRYDNWDTQRKLFDYPLALCIVEMPFGGAPGGSEKNRQFMENTYGGIYNLIVKDGKQWLVMAPKHLGDHGFTKIDNSSTSRCERAIGILVTWDESGVWQQHLVPYIKDCKDPILLSEIKSLTKGLPDAAQKEIKTYYMLQSRSPDRLMEILTLGNVNPALLDDDDKELLAEARNSIGEGSFAWTVALRPLIEDDRRYNLAHRLEGVPAAEFEGKQSEIFQTLANAAFAGIKFALDSQMQASKQRLAKIRMAEGREPSDDEKISAYSALNKLREYLKKPEVTRMLITPVQYAGIQQFEGLMQSADRAEIPGITAMLKDALVFKLASMKKRLSQHENAILSTGNHHAIRYYYQNAVRGDTGVRLAPGGGLPWPELESFIIDELMSGKREGELRATLIDYLGKVKDATARMSMMQEAIAKVGGERAPALIVAFNRLLPIKLRIGGVPTA
jgi:hypothetical protein